MWIQWLSCLFHQTPLTLSPSPITKANCETKLPEPTTGKEVTRQSDEKVLYKKLMKMHCAAINITTYTYYLYEAKMAEYNNKTLTKGLKARYNKKKMTFQNEFANEKKTQQQCCQSNYATIEETRKRIGA